MKYEYKTLEIEKANDPTIDLNEQGSYGWQLVCSFDIFKQVKIPNSIYSTEIQFVRYILLRALA